MADDVGKHFLAIVEDEFPKHGEFRVRRESGDVYIYVDWKLGNDPERPNKRSKKIKICISQEAVEDYMGGDDNDRKIADEKLRRIVAIKFKAFNPEHDVPAHAPVPIEQWTITTEMLNA
jgi:hypothetical protein